MDRERWHSYPAGTDDERRFLARLAATPPDEVTVTAEGTAGEVRPLHVRRSVELEEPFGGKAGLVCRIVFAGEAPAEGERVRENLWELGTDFLEKAEAAARSGG